MRRLILVLPLILLPLLPISTASAEDAPPAPEAVRIERIDSPDGVPRYRVWPAEMVPAVAESLGVPLDRISVAAPLETRRPSAVAPPARRVPSAEDTPESVLWHDHCAALEERRIGRGEEIGGIAAIGVRLGGKGQASEMGEVDAAVRASVDAWNERGALVVSLVPGAPAELAGLQVGDVIVQLTPFWIDTPATFIRMASRADVGAELELLVLRRGQVERTWVTPIDRKEMEALQR